MIGERQKEKKDKNQLQRETQTHTQRLTGVFPLNRSVSLFLMRQFLALIVTMRTLNTACCYALIKKQNIAQNWYTPSH